MSSLICPLCSGSDGNSTYIKIGNNSFLVDIGKSCRQIERSMSKNKINPHNVNFIFITHEHIDHVRGLNVFARKYNTKIYASLGTIKSLEEKQILNDKIEYEILDLSGLAIDELNVVPFCISHDCSQGFGYSFLGNNIKISVCSDLGFVSSSVFDAISGSDAIIIESNHDVEMLESGPYPFFLKKRIMSEKGHLSNVDCSEVIYKLAKSGTKKFILCHLSKTNNTPQMAYDLAFSAIENAGVSDCELYIAPRTNTTNVNIRI